MIRLKYSTLLYSTRLPIKTFSDFNFWFKSSPLNEFLVTCQHQATAFDLPFYDIFAPTKNSCFKVSDDEIACDMRFGPPTIKNPGYAYAAVSVGLQRSLRQFDGECTANPRRQQYDSTETALRIEKFLNRLKNFCSLATPLRMR